jgi:hypothetical protein
VHSFHPSAQSIYKRHVITTFIAHTSSSSKEGAPSSTVLLCPLWPFFRALYTTTNRGSTVGTVIRLQAGQISNYGIIHNRGNRTFSSSPNLHSFCTRHIFLLNGYRRPFPPRKSDWAWKWPTTSTPPDAFMAWTRWLRLCLFLYECVIIKITRERFLYKLHLYLQFLQTHHCKNNKVISLQITFDGDDLNKAMNAVQLCTPTTLSIVSLD